MKTNNKTYITDDILERIYHEETDHEEPTVIHFIVYPSPKFSEGWWVHLYDSIFIRPNGTKQQLGLIYAFNIPIAPEKHFFKNLDDELRFTLFFPPLPKGTTHIDIIEKPNESDPHYFNYYLVPMKRILRESIKHR